MVFKQIDDTSYLAAFNIDEVEQILKTSREVFGTEVSIISQLTFMEQLIKGKTCKDFLRDIGIQDAQVIQISIEFKVENEMHKFNVTLAKLQEQFDGLITEIVSTD